MALNLTTIDYDRPVKNLIPGLVATGHVTTSSWKKTCVTFHHNGGRLSHEGCLEVWKVRPASAQFDVDAAGNVAQYANAYWYAWACGNTTGNQTSISIEMCNATLAPKWEVAEVTWRSAARLAAWLFKNIIGTAPTTANIKVHHDWLATACAGPYIDSVRRQLVAAVQTEYVALIGAPGGSSAPVHPVKPTPAPVKPKPSGLAVDGWLGRSSVSALQRLLGTPVDGIVSGQRVTNKPYLWAMTTVQYQSVSAAHGSTMVKALQRRLHVTADGHAGQDTVRAIQRHVGVKADGVLGNATAKAVQRALNSGKF